MFTQDVITCFCVKLLTCPDVCKAVLQLSQSHSDLPLFHNFHNPNKTVDKFKYRPLFGGY